MVKGWITNTVESQFSLALDFSTPGASNFPIIWTKSRLPSPRSNTVILPQISRTIDLLNQFSFILEVQKIEIITFYLNIKSSGVTHVGFVRFYLQLTLLKV